MGQATQPSCGIGGNATGNTYSWGKHLSQSVVPTSLIDCTSAQVDGGYDEIVDLIDATLLRVALLQPEIFLDVTCRGFQMVFAHLTQQLPMEIAHHRAPDGTPVVHHWIQYCRTTLRRAVASKYYATCRALRLIVITNRDIHFRCFNHIWSDQS